MVSNNGLCLHAAAWYVLLFLVLAVHSNCFRFLQSYTLLLKPPVLIRSWTTRSPSFTLPHKSPEMRPAEDVTLQHKCTIPIIADNLTQPLWGMHMLICMASITDL